ncbi:hypothetical protein ACHWQZ_G006676 [Mnemiopsis leidyi]
MEKSIARMKEELKGINGDINDLRLSLDSEDDTDKKTEIQERINDAETARTLLKAKLVDAIETDCLSNKDSGTTAAEPLLLDSKSTALPSTSSANKTSNSDYSNALLSCVDDITLQKLMPVVENLTDDERRNIKLLLDTCREALYPKSEMRALRQQLTSAKIVQPGEEELEEFAARIRSIVNKAGYTTEADKSEACLNAFLNGLYAELADKLYAAPDVENSFEVAVSTARKLEKMRKVRAPPATPETDILSSVFRVSQSRGSRDQHQNQNHTDRSHEQRDLLSQVSNYGRQGKSSTHQPRPANSSQAGRSERRVRTETRTCYRCGVKGHIARFCRAAEPLNL